jgi:transketolase
MSIIHDRILEISKKHHCSHLGGSLTSADIISDIYHIKKDDEPFILSCGHNAMALYCVLEQYYGYDAEKLYLKHGTHPNRDLKDRIHCSTGSLGLGISIALGMAISNRDKNVYCLISDGESFEGVIWEVSNVVMKYKITNLKLYCNYNGFGAYDSIDYGYMVRLKVLFPDMKIIKNKVEDYGLIGQEAHYISADKI